MIFRRDPLENPERLIERVYSYVAYRVGEGAEAEDITSDVFERAVRYRSSYDSTKGSPVSWLIGIARHTIADAGRSHVSPGPAIEQSDPRDLESDVVRRLTLRDALSALSDRDRDLLALRYGADLSARQIATLSGASTNAIEVALHRALHRLRAELAKESAQPGAAGL